MVHLYEITEEQAGQSRDAQKMCALKKGRTSLNRVELRFCSYHLIQFDSNGSQEFKMNHFSNTQH